MYYKPKFHSGLSVHAFGWTGQENIIPTCRSAGNYYIIFPNQKMKISLEKMIFFNIVAQNIHCGYTLEPPGRGESNEYPQCMFGSKIRKIHVGITLQGQRLTVKFRYIYLENTFIVSAFKSKLFLRSPYVFSILSFIS